MMNGGPKTAQDDVKAALQPLFASFKENAKVSQARVPAQTVDDGNGEDDGAYEEEHPQATSTLRSLFKAEIQKVMRPPKAAAALVDFEGQVSRLLEKVSAPHLPEPRQVQEPGTAGAGAGAAPQAQRPKLPCRDSAVQTEVLPLVGLMDLDDEPPAEPPPVELPPEPPKRSMVVKGEGATAAMLRTQVTDARRRLTGLDQEVTRLTAELKAFRRKVWEVQRRHCSSEAKLTEVFQQRTEELPSDLLDRERRLQREERMLVEELSEARASSARWSSVAKRQDSMLQQERDHKGDAQSILAKHPAGEIFLPNIPADTDSDDGYYNDGPRRPARAPGVHEDVSLGTSDEDDEDDFKQVWNRRRPMSLRAPYGLESEKDDDSLSGGSSLPSPSGDSAMGHHASKSPPGEAADRAMFGGRGHGGPGTGAREAAGNPGRGRTSTQSSETTSDEDDPPRNALGMASLAGKSLMERVRNDGEANAVPPLPELSGNPTRGRSLLPKDEVEEITSEEDFEEDTSQSA